MKKYNQIFFFIFELIFTAFTLVGQTEQPKEVLIIGTMHEVPKIIRHSYKPLLKKAIASMYRTKNRFLEISSES